MSKNRITMTKIAQIAGVSQPTVSIVLNGAENISISSETKEKVLKIAQDLGYNKHLIKKHPTNKRVILLVDGAIYTNDHFVSCINSISTKANELGLILNIMTTQYSESQRQITINEINSGFYDAAIIASTMTNDNCYDFKIDIPHIYLNCYPKNNFNVISILPDDYTSLNQLAKQLVNTYKNPKIFAGDAWMLATLDRTRAIRDAYIEHGITITTKDIIYTDWSAKNAYLNCISLLESKEHIDIIYCGSDYIALGIYQALKEKQIKIGQDIAVVGYDNQMLTEELLPTLTSIELPYESMAQLAIITVHKILNNKEQINSIHKVKGKIILRDSTNR